MKRNAFFQLIQKEDGLYLKSYPALDGGEPVTMEDVMLYLEKKKIMDVQLEDIAVFIADATEQKNAEQKILPEAGLTENEFPIITIDPQKRFAKIRLYPPSNKGRRLSPEEILDRIRQCGITTGIVTENIKLLLKARLYCTDILIAKAVPPVEGSDAEITYHFDVDKTCTPTMDENGNVDFHQLDMIEGVSEGQLLATLRPADIGQPGTDVMGGPLKPRKVKQLTLKHGKNIHLSEDKCEMYSDVAGNVTLVNDTVFVSDQYEVPADVGPSTGDIEYDGSVVVKGNVLTGYKIKAAGDITVNGVVEGAELITEGKIVLKRGIQGKGKAKMQAQGDVISNFIESASVVSGGRIMTDAIMHSDIIAEDDVLVKGKRGLIAGGSVKTKTKIEAKTLGSTMGTMTVLEVGIDPKVVERYHLIEKEMDGLQKEKETLFQNLKLLKKRLETRGKLDEEKMAGMKKSADRINAINVEMEKLKNESDILEEELKKKDSGKIIAENIAYPGVKMTISTVTNSIKSEVQHSAFVRDGADIRVRAI